MSAPARRPRVVGLDLSLASTGVSDGQSCHAFQTFPTEPVEDRLSAQFRRVRDFVLTPSQVTSRYGFDCRADLVVIEGSSYGSRGPGHEELAALRLMIRVWLRETGVPFAMVPPATAKKYTTGTGTATKAEMEKALRDRHGLNLSHFTLKAGRADMVDAYALAAMGADFMGRPFRSYGTPPLATSLAAVKWPFFVAVDEAAEILNNTP